MRVKPVGTIPTKKTTEVGKKIEQFKESGLRYAELTDWQKFYGDKNRGYRSIWMLAKRANIKVHRRDDKIFLENMEADDERTES